MPGGSKTNRYFILTLLVVSICINYVDRANLSAAAEDLSKELSMDPKRIGVLLSSFFWTYMLFQIPVGWLISRFNVYWVYALGYFVWSGATLLTGFASGFNTLLGLRLLLGMAESVAYPSYSKILSAGFSEHERGLPNSLIDAGSKLGPFVGLLIGGSIIAAFDWRAMFIIIGGVSMLWLIPWMWAVRRTSKFDAADQQGHGPDISEILAKPQAWGTFFGLMGSNYAWYFLLTWLPSYLRRERHFSAEAMATAGSIPFLAVAASAVFSGWLSDRLIRRGYSPTLIRKGFVVTGLVGAMLLYPAALAPESSQAIALLTAASLFFGIYTSNTWALTQALAGTHASAKWTALENTLGNLSGILAPYLTGWIVAETGSFTGAFIAAVLALAMAAASFQLLVPRVEPLAWRSGHEH